VRPLAPEQHFEPPENLRFEVENAVRSSAPHVDVDVDVDDDDDDAATSDDVWHNGDVDVEGDIAPGLSAAGGSAGHGAGDGGDDTGEVADWKHDNVGIDVDAATTSTPEGPPPREGGEGMASMTDVTAVTAAAAAAIDAAVDAAGERDREPPHNVDDDDVGEANPNRR